MTFDVLPNQGLGSADSPTFAGATLTGALTSTVATGTAPLVVSSTTNVANLNASSLGGATFAAPGAIGGGTAAAGTFASLSANQITLGTRTGNPANSIGNNGANNQLQFNGGTAGYVFNDSGNTANLAVITNTGSVGIGTTSPQALLSLAPSSTGFRNYNAFTDASNGEWFENVWSGNVLTMGTNKNGTGVARNLQIEIGGAQAVLFNTAGAAFQGTGSFIGDISAKGSAASFSLFRRDTNFIAWTLYSPDGSLRFFSQTNGGGLGDTWKIGTDGSLSASYPLSASNGTFSGVIINTGMPTSDPHVAGELYSVTGVVHISAG